MTFKIILSTSVVLSLVQTSRTAVIPFENEESSDHYHDKHDIASSYMHFHGPVEGPEFEVKIPYFISHHNELVGLEENGEHEDVDHEKHLDHHVDYTHDYVAHPKYEYSYGVEDYHTGDFHSQKEHRNGDSVSGEYTVSEPGGAIRTVSYKADKDGFHAVVHRLGKTDHSGGTYSHVQHYPHHEELSDQHQFYQQHHQLDHESDHTLP